jgi:hypothetical protein
MFQDPKLGFAARLAEARAKKKVWFFFFVMRIVCVSLMMVLVAHRLSALVGMYLLLAAGCAQLCFFASRL